MLFYKILLLFATVVAMPIAYAQHPIAAASGSTTSLPSFDAVSIKPAKPGTVGSHSNFSNDSFTASNVTLKSLIQFDAYGVPGPQIFGIPAPLSKAAFDIEAKIDPGVYTRIKALPGEQFDLQVQQMLRQLLADYFKLAVHTETRQLPVYALVLAKGGPKLQSAKNPTGGAHREGRTGQLSAQGVSTADLAQSLTRTLQGELGRIVLDQTGLTGKYDFILKWTPDTGPPPTLNGEPDTSAPSIFTAVQEQLGLRLEPAKGPVPLLIVDHAEMPSAN